MSGDGRRPDAEKNLAGTGCPMNLVYAKFELARLAPGNILKIILDDGAPVENVCRSLAGEGHEILKREQLGDGTWSLLIRRG